ncbi:MAG: hypothetical protein Q7R85_03910 [bacterium]|nr:hypothetical protein [bacterium]
MNRVLTVVIAVFALTVRLSTPVAATSEECGVVVTNDTDTNVTVFGGGMSGVTVPPGRSCLVPFPRGWAWLTVRVVQMNGVGDFFDPESRLYKTDEVGAWRVKRHEF